MLIKVLTKKIMLNFISRATCFFNSINFLLTRAFMTNPDLENRSQVPRKV